MFRYPFSTGSWCRLRVSRVACSQRDERFPRISRQSRDSAHDCGARTRGPVSTCSRQQNFAAAARKRVGLVTNQTGVDSAGAAHDRRAGARAGSEAGGAVQPRARHCRAAWMRPWRIRPTRRRACRSTACTARRGGRRDEMLKNLDALVFDIQDAGVRFYTYVTTMAYCMEAAAKQHVAFFVLDRPDPSGRGSDRRADARRREDVVRRIFPDAGALCDDDGRAGADVQRGKQNRRGPARGRHEELAAQRDLRSDGARWIPPSPNLRTVHAAFLYPGIEILQAGGVSVGRGTDAPFEIFGAPWIRAVDELRNSNAAPDSRWRDPVSSLRRRSSRRTSVLTRRTVRRRFVDHHQSRRSGRCGWGWKSSRRCTGLYPEQFQSRRRSSCSARNRRSTGSSAAMRRGHRRRLVERSRQIPRDARRSISCIIDALILNSRKEALR